MPSIDLVVRNVSGGSARDITFEFSAPVEDSKGFVVSDLPYLKRGVNFLGPGSHVACFWDDLEPLVASLREKGLDEGISVAVKYRDLTGESYEKRWTINPLLYEATATSPARVWATSLPPWRSSTRPSPAKQRVPRGNARPVACPLKRP